MVVVSSQDMENYMNEANAATVSRIEHQASQGIWPKHLEKLSTQELKDMIKKHEEEAVERATAAEVTRKNEATLLGKRN